MLKILRLTSLLIDNYAATRAIRIYFFATILISVLRAGGVLALDRVVDVSSKEFTEDFVHLGNCGIVMYKLLGVHSQKLHIDDALRAQISSANFGWLDEGRLYEMNFEFNGFYSDSFLEGYISRFDQASQIRAELTRGGMAQISEEHAKYLLKKISSEASLTLGEVYSSNAETFHQMILSCDKFVAHYISYYERQ
jgi:hypothetical protein